MLIVIAVLILLAAAWIVHAVTHHQRLQIAQAEAQAEAYTRILQDLIQRVETLQDDTKRVAGYVRYLRARAWEDDPRFIEDVHEGTSKFSPKWHDLKTEYGLWVRETDEHEGTVRVMRGERTKTEQYLREQVGDDEYERIRALRDAERDAQSD